MIVDAHAHTFPFVGNVGDFDSEADHVRQWQIQISTHRQGARRVRDNVVVSEPLLWDGKTYGLKGLRESNFRVGKGGAFEWETDGESYYHQYFAPTLDDMIATPERMLAQMRYIGVSKALIQYGKNYGVTDPYLSEVIAKWPEVFRGCTAVEEDIANEDSQIEKLNNAVTKYGLSALYYGNNGFSASQFKNHFDDAKYAGFWREVSRLGIPVAWDIRFSQRSTHADYMEEALRLQRLMRTLPNTRHVLTHSVPKHALNADGAIPEALWSVFEEPNLTIEVLFPILDGHRWEYPYLEAQPIIRQLYDRLGPKKLIWGSDMPNVERNCTYKQSLDYFRKYSDYIPAADWDVILGQNSLDIYFSGVGSDASIKKVLGIAK